ncbi:MAG: hypothetical protein A2Y36_08210 [Treponema sp. GWA1_62_8]|nr:MAG: hypothetical protein A2Y36_08210 [Treponema sp. GWA1_62_8]
MSLITSAEYALGDRMPALSMETGGETDSYASHDHEFTEIAFVLSGRGRHVLDGFPSELRSGDCFVIPPLSVHSFQGLEDFRVLNLLFLENILVERVPSLACVAGYRSLLHLEPRLRDRKGFGRPLHPGAERFARIIGLVRLIGAEAAGRSGGGGGGGGAATASIAALTLVLVELSREMGEADSEGARRLASLEKVLSFVDARYAQELSLADLASAGAMSEATLARRFREALGLTPMAWLAGERLRRARLLVDEGQLTVSEIAARTGFCDGSRLSRAFKEATGFSPRQWRRERAAVRAAERFAERAMGK